jgi:NitT/TauT family transport system ATP-binding protein
MIALEFDRVSRDFQSPSGKPYRVLDDVSLAVSAGAFVAIVGPSGCGKTTLLNLAAGLLPATRGAIRVDGAPLAGLNRQATYMFQQDALLPWKTVRDNVALGPMLSGTPARAARRHADAWLTRVGLTGFAFHYPGQLSGGMRKRVAMAQNWILGRSQVLMDEPFSSLDVHTRQHMGSALLALWEADNAPLGFDESAAARSSTSQRPRRTIVLVTHDLHEAIALADEVIVLSAGPSSRIVARHPVNIPRPRSLLDVQLSAEFVDLYRRLWAVLREEVVRSQREAPRDA